VKRFGRCRAGGRLLAVALGLAALGAGGGTVLAGDLPAPTPVPALPAIDDPNFVSTRLIPVPAGCAAPDREQAVFLGTLVKRDEQTARFSVEQVRSGTLDGFTLNGEVDVRFGDDVQLLDIGTTYLVGAGADSTVRALVSRVLRARPLFGGSGVAGVNPSVANCPSIDDPVRTLRADGGTIETGVLAPISTANRSLLLVVLEAVGLVLAGLVALVLVKHAVFGLGRAVRRLLS